MPMTIPTRSRLHDTRMPPDPTTPTLPASARLPINRCNLPAVILGSLTFQHHPAPLLLDGVAELHRGLFRALDDEPDHAGRVRLFCAHMAAHFCLDALEDAGFDRRAGSARPRADYLRTLRGWLFDPDGREAAVLKGWVESRFGLLPRFHRLPIPSPEDAAYRAYLEARSAGLYNTNALESQFDLLFTFCQYELARTRPGAEHLRLYRGINRLEEHETLARPDKRRRIVVLNNLNSFTDNRERADEFGDHVIEASVPRSKVVFYNRLLPGALKGEDEYLVIGGVYEVTVVAA